MKNTLEGSDVLRGVPTSNCDIPREIKIFTQGGMLSSVKISNHLWVYIYIYIYTYIHTFKKEENWTSGVPPHLTVATDKACREP